MASPAKRDSMDIDPSTKKMENSSVSKISQSLHTTSLDPRSKTTLITLPASIRNNIYKKVLDTELVNVGKPNVSYTHSLKDGVLQFQASRPPFPVCTALFYVNKQVSREARHFFYSQNLFIRLTLFTSDARHAKTMLEDSGLLFSVATHERVRSSTQHAADVVITEKHSQQRRAEILFPAQYLPRLINFLEQASKATKSWGPSHGIEINVRNTYEFPLSRFQGDILEAFRLLQSIGSVSICPDNLLPGYPESLQRSMQDLSFDGNTWVSDLTALSEFGDMKLKEKKWDIASQYYASVTIALTYGYLTRAESLHSQPDPELFCKKIQRLRWHIELHTSIALASLHVSITSSKSWLKDSKSELQIPAVAKDILAAETAASQALSLATDSPNPASNPWIRTLPAELIPPNKPGFFSKSDIAWSWMQCGIVHMALGEYLFAAGDLERATGFVEGNEGLGEEIAREFEKAREGIDWNVKPGDGLRKAAREARRG